MWEKKRLRIIFISTLVAMIVSILHMLNLISDEMALCKLEAASVLDRQVASVQNEYVLNINSGYELRALVYGANGKYTDSQIIGEQILKHPNIRNILYAPHFVVSNASLIRTSD